jgi:3'-phosphoadenosine 5'-phosphosulfate sulfotransferase (PAPS reductase)/FAD synthetase
VYIKDPTNMKRRKLSFCDNGFLFKPKKYQWYQCYPIAHWLENDIYQYLDDHVPDFYYHKNIESGCLCCATDITRSDNNLRRLYNLNYTLWRKYMESGMAKQILIAKGLNIDKLNINEMIEKSPQWLLKI